MGLVAISTVSGCRWVDMPDGICSRQNPYVRKASRFLILCPVLVASDAYISGVFQIWAGAPALNVDSSSLTRSQPLLTMK